MDMGKKIELWKKLNELFIELHEIINYCDDDETAIKILPITEKLIGCMTDLKNI